MIRRPPISTRSDTLFPYTTLFRSHVRTMIAACKSQSQRKKKRLSFPACLFLQPRREVFPHVIAPGKGSEHICSQTSERALFQFECYGISRAGADCPPICGLTQFPHLGTHRFPKSEQRRVGKKCV